MPPIAVMPSTPKTPSCLPGTGWEQLPGAAPSQHPTLPAAGHGASSLSAGAFLRAAEDWRLQSLNKLEIRLNFLPQFHKLCFLRLGSRPGALGCRRQLRHGGCCFPPDQRRAWGATKGPWGGCKGPLGGRFCSQPGFSAPPPEPRSQTAPGSCSPPVLPDTAKPRVQRGRAPAPSRAPLPPQHPRLPEPTRSPVPHGGGGSPSPARPAELCGEPQRAAVLQPRCEGHLQKERGRLSASQGC